MADLRYYPGRGFTNRLDHLFGGSYASCCGSFHSTTIEAESCGVKAVARRLGNSLDTLASSLGADIRLANRLDALRQAVSSGRISHSRAKEFCRQWSIHIYQRDPTSPTGVRLFDSFPENTPGLLDILRGGLSPLSPTEGR